MAANQPPPPQPPNCVISKLNEEEISYLASKFKNIRIPTQKISLATPSMRVAHDKWSENRSLIVTILHGETKNPEIVAKDLKTTWRCQKVEISLRAPNRFACNFDRIQDRARITNYQPWMIGKFLVLIQPFSSDMDANQIVFDTIPVWIRFFGLHIDHISEENIRSIASGAGEVMTVDPSGAPPRSIAGYKARVELKIDESVKQNSAITTINDGLVCVDYIYVDLPDCYCPRCEKIGFDRFDCNCTPLLEIGNNEEEGGTVEPNLVHQVGLGPQGGVNLAIGPGQIGSINPNPPNPTGSQFGYLPHQLMNKGKETESVKKEATTTTKPRFETGSSSKNNHGKEAMDLILEIKEGDDTQGNTGKKRKMMLEYGENQLENPTYNNQSNQINLTENTQQISNSPLTTAQFWDLMLVPEVVTQLVEQGVINPAIYGFLNIDNQLSMGDHQSGIGILDQFETQQYAQQLVQMAQMEGETGETNYILGENSVAEGFADSITTVDHLGAMENRVNGGASLDSQTNANLTPNAAYEFAGDKVHPGAAPHQ